MAKTLIGDKEFQIVSTNAKLSFPDKKDFIFNFVWDSGAQAAGLTALANANALTIANNFDLQIKRITVTCVRRNAGGVTQQSGSLELTISSALNIGENLNISAIGAQWSALPSFIQVFTPEAPQLEVNGFKVLGGSNLTFNLQSFNFGTTVLNDEILAFFSIQY